MVNGLFVSLHNCDKAVNRRLKKRESSSGGMGRMALPSRSFQPGKTCVKKYPFAAFFR